MSIPMLSGVGMLCQGATQASGSAPDGNKKARSVPPRGSRFGSGRRGESVVAVPVQGCVHLVEQATQLFQVFFGETRQQLGDAPDTRNAVFLQRLFAGRRQANVDFAL